MKKVPMRKCLVSNQSFPKKELFRVVKTKDNQVILDITGKILLKKLAKLVYYLEF